MSFMDKVLVVKEGVYDLDCMGFGCVRVRI